MPRYLSLALIVLLSSADGSSFVSAMTRQKDEQPTPSELQQVKEVAASFTANLLESQDLTPVISELYAHDFIERFLKHQMQEVAKGEHRTTGIMFLPGLDYGVSALTEASAEDWRRFYIASNNFLFFGIVSVMEKYLTDPESVEDLKSSDLYPQEVIELLKTNPHLANFIKKKGNYVSITTKEDMRNATATLELAVATLRKGPIAEQAKKLKQSDKLLGLMNEDEMFKPKIETVSEESWGVSKGSRMAYVITPLLFQLTLVKEGKEFKILRTAPYTGD